MLGVVAVVLAAGELLNRLIDSNIFAVLYLLAALLLVIWIAWLAGADIWATQYHFGKLRHKNLIEQAKLHGEIRRVQSAEGNGKAAERGEERGESG